MTIPGTVSLGSCSFFVSLRPAKNVKKYAARDLFSGSHDYCVIMVKTKSIEFSDSESIGELRRHLRSHITRLRKGKESEWSRNQCAASESEHNSRLNKIRNEWPQPTSLDLKEDCIRNFRVATSSESLRQFTCACCVESVNVSDRKVRRYFLFYLSRGSRGT